MTDNSNNDNTPVPPGGGSKSSVPPRGGSKGGRSQRPKSSGTNAPGNSASPRTGTSPSQRRQAQFHQRRNRQLVMAGVAAVVVVAVVVVLILVKTSNDNNKKPVTAKGVAVSATVPGWVYSGFKGVSPQALAAAANNYSASLLEKPTAISGPKLTTDGKPTMLYMGAEYCPYCATERWAMMLALSQFGSFSNLHFIRSWDGEPAGGAPNLVPTFTFYKSSYSSPYVHFTSVETENRAQEPLQTSTTEENKLAAKYDVVDGQSSIPFIYFDGLAKIVGASYDPSLLQPKGYGDWLTNAKSIIGGTSKLSSSVYAVAGYMDSNICAMTGGKPGNVCKYFPKPIDSGS